MSGQPSNPISVNQIVDTNLNLKCITEPSCRTLPNDVQALLDDYCLSKFDKSKIASKCVTLPVNADINITLNEIFTKICTVTTTSPLTEAFITGMNFCNSDLWTYGNNPCLTILDNCSNPVVNITEEDVFRALIKRIIALQNLVTTLNTTNNTQQTLINSLTAQVDNIILNCCSTSLVSSIQTINSRLTAAGIP